MKAKYCVNCGNLMEENDRFCQECGHKREEETEPAAQNPASGQPVDRQQAPATANQMDPAELGDVLRGSFAYLENRQYDAGLGYMLKHFDRAGGYPEYLCQLARFYRLAGMGNMALLTYRDCIAKHPDYAVAYTNLSLVHMDRGEYKEAEKMCVSAIQQYRKDPSRYPQAIYGQMYANYARSVALQGRLADAELLIREAEKLGSDKGALLRREFGL